MLKIKPKIYLCGPINGCTDEECTEWRELFKKDNRFVCIDPMRRDYRGVEDIKYREIVEADKIDISMSNIVIVNYTKPSTGTSMEVYIAWTWGKPVIIVKEKGVPISPWLKYHSTVITYGFSDAKIQALSFWEAQN